MPYGQFVGYEPTEGGYDFSTKDGKKLRLVGETAEDLRKKLDGAAFVAPKPANVTPVSQEPAPAPEYTPPNATALTGWLRNEPAPAPPPPAEPGHEEKQAALMSWIRGEEPPARKFGDSGGAKDPGTAWKAIEAARGPELPDGSRVGAFARSAIPAALDAAALPVTLAGKVAEHYGYPNQAAHLSGQDALEAGEFLARGVDPAQQRREQTEERKNFPASSNLGEDVGTYAGGAKSGELAARGVGAAVRGGVQAGKYLANEVAAAGGIKQVAKDVALSPVHAMTGLGSPGGGATSVAKKQPAAVVRLSPEPAAAEQSWTTLRSELSEPVARGLVGEVPGLGAQEIRTFIDGKKTVVKAYAANKDTLVERAYHRDLDGALVAEHKLFALPPEQKGKGVGKAALKKQVETYDQIGVDRIEMSAEMDGRAVWPRMGFELKNPDELQPMKDRFAKYLRDRGVPPEQANSLAAAPTNIHELALVVAPKSPKALSGQVAPSGSAFLKQWPSPIELKADLKGASGEQLRHYLGVE